MTSADATTIANDTNDAPERARFYITTAIDYPNAPPHIGHSLEKVAADVMARYHRLLGHDVAFTMGNDENSQHVVTAALANGTSPSEWTDRMDVAFRRAWDALAISRTSWVRTTEERHVRASQELFRRAQASGDIYTSTYAGWYCPNCNTFYAEDELVDGHCPLHPTVAPEYLEEENYFFDLKTYTDRLRALVRDEERFIVPAHRRAEVLTWIDQGLRDFSVSRRARTDGIEWGVPVPGDPSQVLYVWFDALTTYVTGIGFPDDPATFERYWPADVHVIGKDITRFHCLYWPAMMMSAGLPVPRQIAVHGFLTLEGARISKSTGNIIDPVEVVEEFGADPCRYYLMRDVSFASDGDFSRANLIRRYTDDLANDLGNLLNRVVAMISRYRDGAVPEPGLAEALESELIAVAVSARATAERELGNWAPDRALDGIWTLVRRANQYLEERQPWKIAKRPEEAGTLDTTLAHAAEATRVIATLLAPYIPDAAARISAQLGLPAPAEGDWERAAFWAGPRVGRVEPAGTLFPRLEVAEAVS